MNASAPETPEETIERLLKANNRLAQMVKAGSDRLAESARELMAQGWDAGYRQGKADHCDNSPSAEYCDIENTNPYRQPIELPGGTK